jgi:alpha-amylase
MRIHYKSCMTLVLVILGCVNVDSKAPHTNLVEDWRDEIIYQIMIDRFEDGDPSNNFNVNYLKEAAYHGGDWQGVIDRLDYIEALGVTALWISPVVKNVESDAGFASYHGYWTQDFLSVNPHFGDLTKLKELVRKAHDRDIKVILDIVTNHVGQLFYYDINRNAQPDIVFYGGGGQGQGSQTDSAGNQGSNLRRVSEWDPEFDYRGIQGFTSLGENGLAPLEWMFDPSTHRMPPVPAVLHNPNLFNRKGRVTVWEDECACFEQCDQSCDGLYDPFKNECTQSCFAQLREQEILGDFPGGLKDLKTTDPRVRNALIDIFKYWIEVADLDGFRIDTLKHVEPEFFEAFAPAMRAHAKSLGKENFFMFGEAFDGKDFLLGSYTHGEGVDSVFYFSAKYQIFDDVFGRGAPTENIEKLYTSRSADTRFGDGSSTRSRYSYAEKVGGLTTGDGNPLVPGQALVHFIDNHDVPRWLYDFNNDLSAYRNALSFLLTTDGIPCIYYGTEQDFSGGPDPSNREDMWRSEFATTGQTFKHIQKLIKIRKEQPALRRGDLKFVMVSSESTAGQTTAPQAGIVAFSRTYQSSHVLVVLNTHSEKTSRTISDSGGMTTEFPPGTQLLDLISESTFDVSTDGRLVLEIPPNQAMILVPISP